MAVLLLRLAAPLQSWGADSKFETRRTNREPTKSGVIGLLAAAIGLSRDKEEELNKLNTLRFGIRVDREGELLVDFHTANNPEEKNAKYLTYRHYLQDAVFLVGLEHEDTKLLSMLQDALTHPAFTLYLGRRSCPPVPPLVIGIRQGELLSVLMEEPRLCDKEKAKSLRIIIDAEPGEYGAAVIRDVPVSFSPKHRQYGYRSVKEDMLQKELIISETTEHDPFSEL